MEQTRKIRVLETIRQGKIGGGERHVLDLVAAMDKQLFEPVVLSFTDGPMIRSLQELRIPVHVIQSERAFDILVWKRVKRFLQEQRIDIVHVHGTRANTNVLWAARRLGLPVIYTVHGWSFHEGLHPVMKKLRVAAERYITRKARVNICVSESNNRTGQEALGSLKARVVHNGVNLVQFNREAAYPDVKAAYGIPAHHLVVAYVARMTLQKDPVGMVNTFAEVVRQVPDITLLMIGEGELKQAAIAAAVSSGISRHIIFDQFRQDVPAVLHAADIYCLPSLWEGFPIGVLEAMAMGKAVVASDVDGTREAVEHGVNGWLVPAQNNQALAAAIVQLATNKELRTRLQQQAWQTIRAKYQIGDMARKIEEVYQEVFTEASNR